MFFGIFGWVLVFLGGAYLLSSSGDKDYQDDSFGVKSDIKDKIVRVLAQIESGGMRYDIIYIRPGKELAYGLLQTTLRSGGLEVLLTSYISKQGIFANQLQNYMDRVRRKDPSLEKDNGFLSLLKRAGREDQGMQQAQREFFKTYYLARAFEWSQNQGFTLPVSFLAIADTFVHSGSQKPFDWAKIYSFPIDGENEKQILDKYLTWRENWLLGKGGVLATTSFRPREYKRLLHEDPNLEGSVNIRGTFID